MGKRPKKVMILGLDAPIPPRLYKFCKEGKLPALARIIDNGVWARNAMVPLPTITPPNWTSIVTGAWPSTHGVTDFNVHWPGDPLNVTHGGFYSGDVKAEFIWNAIARAGKKSIVVNYPTTWPPTVNEGSIQIGGAGVEVNQYFYPAVLYGSAVQGAPPAVDEEIAFRFAQHGAGGIGIGAPLAFAGLSYERLFSTKKFRSGPGSPILVELKAPTGWSNLPRARSALEGELVVRPSTPRYQITAPIIWQMLALDTKGAGYDKVVVCDRKDASRPMAELQVGQWSPIITREFPTEAGLRRASFTLKLVELSRDAQDMRIYHSAICALDGWAYPASLVDEIKSEKGLPYPQTAFFAFDRGWFDTDTVLEITELERQWLSDACTYLLKNKPWDLFVMHYHPPDHAWHSISWLMDPATAKNEAEWQKFQEVELGIYQACDRLAGNIFGCADPNDTLFALISDHGAKATNGPYFNVNNVLENAGLLARDAEGKIDWSKTKALAQRTVYVYVNLKGRDPNGIVEPRKEYREVQEQVIKALTDFVEPATGRKPILFALRKEDARFINIYGDYVGDVVYAVSELLGPQHGPFLPTAEWGLGSLRGIYVLAGPGVKKGVELERNVWCLDLVPTICYLTGWPIPKNAEGAVIFQALEDPDPK